MNGITLPREGCIPTRDEIDALRAVFIRGYQASGGSHHGATNAAARAYPYPKVTRHRVVEVRTLYAGVRRYRVEGGTLQCQVSGANAPWEESDWSAMEILALADIINRPTEEVDA